MRQEEREPAEPHPRCPGEPLGTPACQRERLGPRLLHLLLSQPRDEEDLRRPVLLGRLFDTIGRKPMIAFTYAISGVLMIGTGYMFMIGAELDFELVRQNAKTGAAVALAGVAVPMLGGSPE